MSSDRSCYSTGSRWPATFFHSSLSSWSELVLKADGKENIEGNTFYTYIYEIVLTFGASDLQGNKMGDVGNKWQVFLCSPCLVRQSSITLIWQMKQLANFKLEFQHEGQRFLEASQTILLLNSNLPAASNLWKSNHAFCWYYIVTSKKSLLLPPFQVCSLKHLKLKFRILSVGNLISTFKQMLFLWPHLSHHMNQGKTMGMRFPLTSRKLY